MAISSLWAKSSLWPIYVHLWTKNGFYSFKGLLKNKQKTKNQIKTKSMWNTPWVACKAWDIYKLAIYNKKIVCYLKSKILSDVYTSFLKFVIWVCLLFFPLWLVWLVDYLSFLSFSLFFFLFTGMNFFDFLFYFGHGTQLAGSQFPNQGLNPGLHSKSDKSEPIDHQGTPRNQLLIFNFSIICFLFCFMLSYIWFPSFCLSIMPLRFIRFCIYH